MAFRSQTPSRRVIGNRSASNEESTLKSSVVRTVFSSAAANLFRDSPLNSRHSFSLTPFRCFDYRLVESATRNFYPLESFSTEIFLKERSFFSPDGH